MAVDIRPRSSWGPRFSDGDLTLSGLADEVFAHHTVTTQLAASASVAEELAEMRKIEAVGQSRFRTGISYNVLIFPSGRAYQGCSFHRRGTHTGGRNSTARSICFAGNYEANEPTAAQLATAAAIYHEGKGKWWKSTAPLRGHRDVSQTACPGKNVYAQLPAIRAGKTRTQQEEPDMDATQAKQLSTVHHILTTKQVPDFDGNQTYTDALRRLLILARRTSTQDIEAAVTKGIKAYAASTPGVDEAAVTKGVVSEVRKALASVSDTEYVLSPKEA